MQRINPWPAGRFRPSEGTLLATPRSSCKWGAVTALAVRSRPEGPGAEGWGLSLCAQAPPTTRNGASDGVRRRKSLEFDHHTREGVQHINALATGWFLAPIRHPKRHAALVAPSNRGLLPASGRADVQWCRKP